MVMSLETHGDDDHLFDHCYLWQLAIYYLNFLSVLQLLASSFTL